MTTRLAVLLTLFLGLAMAPARIGAGAGTGEYLQGRLLVATPQLSDSNFRESVVLVIEHDATGAHGVVINRPYGNAPLGALRELMGAGPGNPRHARQTVGIHVGGPVDPTVVTVVHGTEYRSDETVTFGGEISVTSGHTVLEVIQAIAEGRGPRRSVPLIGYAGWRPDQLEAEIERGLWFSIPADPNLVFAEDRARIWEKALARRDIPL